MVPAGSPIPALLQTEASWDVLSVSKLFQTGCIFSILTSQIRAKLASFVDQHVP